MSHTNKRERSPDKRRNNKQDKRNERHATRCALRAQCGMLRQYKHHRETMQ